MEAESYTVAQMIADLTATLTNAAVYIIPAAILISVSAFILAWFMDSTDLAGRAFGRHR